MNDLIQAWKEAKSNEAAWNQKRIEIESQIYANVEKELPEKGTYTTAEGMKIAIGHTEEWDQSALNEIYNQWEAPVPFPFVGLWKPDNKAISYIRENIPQAYTKLREALTLKPKKPSFSMKDSV
jgi:hypothetical protein